MWNLLHPSSPSQGWVFCIYFISAKSNTGLHHQGLPLLTSWPLHQAIFSKCNLYPNHHAQPLQIKVVFKNSTKFNKRPPARSPARSRQDFLSKDPICTILLQFARLIGQQKVSFCLAGIKFSKSHSKKFVFLQVGLTTPSSSTVRSRTSCITNTRPSFSTV